MRKIITVGAGLAGLLVVPLAGPAHADASACTHNWSGPQVCIRLKGKNAWNSVTGFWANPPARVKKRQVTLYIDGDPSDTETARRVGDTISYKWSQFQTGYVKLCVKFHGINRMACEETKYSGI